MSKMDKHALAAMQQALKGVEEIDRALSQLGQCMRRETHKQDSVGDIGDRIKMGSIGGMVPGITGQKIGEIVIKAVIGELREKRAGIVAIYADDLEFPDMPSLGDLGDASDG